MAEYNKGRYYWIKLTDKFLESDTVDFLMSQKDGANYVVLYQMLCLKTVNNNGVLARQLGEILVPYDIDKITRDCKFFSVDTVRIALELYKRLGLVYEQEDGILRITDFERLIGSQTYGAEKKQLQLQNRGGKNGGTKVENFPLDIDSRERDKDKEINIEKESKEQACLLDYEQVVDIAKQYCPTVYNRFQKQVDGGNLEKARKLMAILDELQGQYTYEQLADLFRHANKTYIVSPNYSQLDLLWVLSNIPKVMGIEERTETPQPQSQPQKGMGGVTTKTAEQINSIFNSEYLLNHPEDI